MWSNLILAALSSIVPAFGFFGSIVEYVTSEDSRAGKRFVLSVITSTLAGGIITNLATEIAAEVFLGSQVSKATDQMTPYNQLALKCDICERYSNYYIRKKSRITCKACLSTDIGSQVHFNDRIYVLQNGITKLHNDLIKLDTLQNSYLSDDSLDNEFIAMDKGDTMTQWVGYINCPYDGEMVKVVCPVIDKTPIKVIAEKTYLFRAGQHNEISCPNCGQLIYLVWYF